MCFILTGGGLEAQPQQLLPRRVAGYWERPRSGRSYVHIVACAPAARTAATHKLQSAGTSI